MCTYDGTKENKKAYFLTEYNRMSIDVVEETDWKLEQRNIRAVAIQFCGDLVYS